MTDPAPRPIAAIRLDGGRLCLDFANTIHERGNAIAEDYLATPERYLDWARRAGGVVAEDDVQLPRSEAERARLMADVRALRDAVYRTLIAWLDEQALPADALAIANAWLGKARADQHIGEDGRLVLRPGQDDATLPLKRIALDLVDTLAQARSGAFRLARCANQTSCGWLFADTSKNGRRRWCAMETCGTSSKMAMLRLRRASKGPPTTDRAPFQAG